MGELALLKILKNNWKLIAVILAIGGLVGYIKVIKLERDHYHKQYQQAEAQIVRLVDSAKIRENQLQADADELSAKYRNTLKTANTLVTENARLNEENIRNAKELRDVKLSLDAIRLFNASKQSPAEANSTPEAKPRNDGETTTTKTTTSVSLQDLLLVVNENDANHLQCIKTVEEWQSFWKDYQERMNASTP